MYLLIILLPLLGSIISGFFGRNIGVKGGQFITCGFIIITTLLSILAFVEVGYNNIPVEIYIMRWIDSESLNVDWGFYFDSLTVSMLFNKKGLIQYSTRLLMEGIVLYKKFISNLKKRSFNFQSFYSKFSEYYPDKNIPKKEFLEWLIGFVEGDGSFIITKRGDFEIAIAQSSKNIQVLNYIKENLGLGSIVSSSKKGTHIFRLQGTKNIYLLCNLFNGNMVFPTRQARFLTFLSFFNEKLLKKNILEPIIPIIQNVTPSLNDCWLLGIIDSKGYFSLSFLSNCNKFRLVFLITQKWEINKPILEYILSLFDCYGLVSNCSGKNSKYLDLKINGLKNCSALFVYLDKYELKTKKKYSYLKWKSLYFRLVKGDHLKVNTKQELIDLAKQINKFD